MSKTTKRILKIAAGTAALGTVAALLMAAISAPLAVEGLLLEKIGAEVTVTETGTSAYQSSMEIYPLVTGKIEKVLVSQGDQVKAGDPLAVLCADDVDYQIQRLQAEIKSYNAQISNLGLSEQKEKDSLQGTRDELNGQLTVLDSEEKSWEKSEQTRETQIILQEQIVIQERNNVSYARQNLRDYRDDYGIDTHDAEYMQLKQAMIDAEKSLAGSEQKLAELQNSAVDADYYDSQRESLHAQIDSVDQRMAASYSGGMKAYYYAQIESAQVSIEELSRKQGEATVTAPCDGVISALPARESNLVSESTSIATIGCDPLIEVYVPVREIDGIRRGDAVQLLVAKRTGDVIGEGTVYSVDTRAETRVSPLGIEEPRVKVCIKAKKAVQVGYQADVAFTVYREEDCLVVPRRALYEQAGQDWVWTIREGTAVPQAVTKGVEVRGGYIIKQGLSEGEYIIADANIQGLAEGKKVSW